MARPAGSIRPTHDAHQAASLPAWRPTLDRLRLVERLQLLATTVLGVGALLLAVVVAERMVTSVENHQRTLALQTQIESIRYEGRLMRIEQLESRFVEHTGFVSPVTGRIEALRERVAALPPLHAPSNEAELRNHVLDDLSAFVVLSRLMPAGLRAGSPQSQAGYERSRPAILGLERDLDSWVEAARAHTAAQLDGTAPFVRRSAAILCGALAVLILSSVILAAMLHRTRRRLANELASSSGELQRLSETDALTSLDNRRAFRARADEAVSEAMALDQPLCVAILDVDHFKAINDAHGHDVGDRTLVQLAVLLTASVAPGHRIARLGGEEFGWLMPGTGVAEGAAWIQRAHDRLARRTLNGVGKLTFSCGIAELRAGWGIEQLLRQADEALYEAKVTGRDRTVGRPVIPPTPAGATRTMLA
jgi:diguanylate cyclase (GGDEF)-like protein